MKDKDAMPFYVWLLPVLCGACSYVHHSYPGDENALWLLGSAPGLWVAPFVFLGKASKAMIPVYIALALATAPDLIDPVMYATARIEFAEPLDKVRST